MRSEDQGAALVVALGVTFVVLLLSTVVVSQAIHNTQQSGYDRRRLTSVNGAEAGINYFFNYIEQTPIASFSTAAVTKSVGSAPNTTSFTVTPTFYSDKAGTTPFTGTISSSNYPRSVKLSSVGSAENGGVARKMESFVVLTPVFGGLVGALIANSNTTFSNNFTVNGNNGNDGDVYVLNGNFSVPSGLETIKGSVWVSNGTASIGTNLHLYGEVWATGSVSVSHPNARVDSHAKSSNSSVTVTTGLVSGNAYYCTGSPPSNVSGSKIQTCSLGSPPTQTFPQIKYDAGAWADQGYWEKVFSGANACTDARTWIEGTGSGQWNGGAGVPSGYTGAVVRITQACTYANASNATISLGKNLAIVTVGGINLSNQSNWNGSGSMKDLHLISSWPDSGSPSCPTQDVSLGNNTNFNSLVQTFVYSGCTVTMNNNNTAFSGQVVGSTLSIGNNFTMTFKPLLVPGAAITGFRQDISYIREVQ